MQQVFGIVLICLIAGTAWGNPVERRPKYTFGHDGRPGCRTPEEINRPWPHNEDPTRFWFCTELNEDAVEVSCPIGAGYQNDQLMCLPWNIWKWSPPQDPPTLAYKNDTQSVKK